MVKDLSSEYLIWVILIPVISAFSYQLDGIFTGATKTRDMRNGAIISLLIFILATIVLIPVLGNHGLWFSYILFIFSLQKENLLLHVPDKFLHQAVDSFQNVQI